MLPCVLLCLLLCNYLLSSQCVLGYFGAPRVTREAQASTAVCYACAMARPRSSVVVVAVALAAACVFLAEADEEQHADGVGSTEAPSASAESSTVEDIEPIVADAVQQAFKLGLPVFTQFGSDPNVSSECSAALVKTMLGLRRMEPWAIRMADSNGKPPPGMLQGSVADLGNFDECLDVVVRDFYGDVDFTGQYCSLFVNPKGVPFLRKMIAKFQEQGEMMGANNPMNWLNQDLFFGIQMGICIPSKCSGTELRHMAATLLHRYGFHTVVRGCQVNETRPLKPYQRGLLIFLGVLSVIILLATAYDVARYYLPEEKKKFLPEPLTKILTAFSVVANTNMLLTTHADSESDSMKLRFIHGMRFWSSSWVILGHTYFLVSVTSLADSLNIIKYHSQAAFLMIANAYPCIQTFLFISGFLVAYNVIKHLKDYKGTLAIPIVLLLVRRYIRITAPVMFLVGVWLLLPLFLTGPLFSEYKDILFGQCEKNWWRVLLHINNWVPFFDMCLGHLWYISVDWQIYACLWVIPMLMIRYKKVGFAVLTLVVLVTSAMVAIQTRLYDYGPTAIYIDTNINKTIDAGNQVYFKPFAHAGAFCVGIATGYAVLVFGAMKINLLMQAAMWVLSGVIAAVVIFGPFRWYKGAAYDTADALLYAATHRTAWSLSLAWMTFACATGRGGLVNRFLSWAAFVPLSRLSFCAFLMQTVVILSRSLVTRERIHYSHTSLFQDFLFAFMMTYMCAFLLFLAIEAPIGNLEKMLFLGSTKQVAQASQRAKAPHQQPSSGIAAPVEVVMMPHKRADSGPDTDNYDTSKSRL
ncbi:nose resistant to fluoxetine protein 6-like [Dermacentor andersoni]|uniref:nose resistant to fluoxetine protein 6-like n=1 Tax=Dermacentor andersoni TaxID=34620 RepID=UPI002417D441|nr:nose resistant to fluoxetine protein 6-like [Dermacentor andersoni]